jgi:hypothetical protein
MSSTSFILIQTGLYKCCRIFIYMLGRTLTSIPWGIFLCNWLLFRSSKSQRSRQLHEVVCISLHYITVTFYSFLSLLKRLLLLLFILLEKDHQLLASASVIHDSSTVSPLLNALFALDTKCLSSLTLRYDHKLVLRVSWLRISDCYSLHFQREFYLERGAMVLADGGLSALMSLIRWRPEDRCVNHLLLLFGNLSLFVFIELMRAVNIFT